VLDLGAGTGKVSRALLAAGFDVVAVEPQAELRQPLAAAIGTERAREGTAEAIPLPDQSVDAVTIADAFHWFDQARALQEIGRVLGPGGGLAILTTITDWSGASWAHELGQLVSGTRPAHPHFDGPRWDEAVRAAPGWGAPWEVRVTVQQPAAPERILAHVASMSWVAAMPQDERDAMLKHARALIAAGRTPAELPLHVVIGLAGRQAG
jgi:SAM-dependent methyltransferase